MEFSEKCCIWCTPAYTYGDCVYFDNKNDAPEEYHIQSILKTKNNIYITSLSKLMYETLKYLPKLFVDKMIKEYMFEHVKVVSQFSRVVNWKKDSDEM